MLLSTSLEDRVAVLASEAIIVWGREGVKVEIAVVG